MLITLLCISFIRCIIAVCFLQHFVIGTQNLEYRLSYLHTYHQRNSSTYYSFYLCLAHGTSLNWLVDENSIGLGYDSNSRLGSVSYRTNQDASAVNSSLLLFLKKIEGENTIFVSLLVVTTDFIDNIPSVQCIISGNYSPPNNESGIKKDSIKSNKSDGVMLDYIFAETITFSSYELVNNVFLCTVNGNKQLWEVNSRTLGLFASKLYGESLQNRVSSEGLVSSVAVLLSLQGDQLVSLMVLTNADSSFLIMCEGNNGHTTLSGDISSGATNTIEPHSNSSDSFTQGEQVFFNHKQVQISMGRKRKM